MYLTPTQVSLFSVPNFQNMCYILQPVNIYRSDVILEFFIILYLYCIYFHIYILLIYTM